MEDKFKCIYSIICGFLLIISCFVLINNDYAVIRIFGHIFLIIMLLILAYIDYINRIIPNKILLIMLVARLAFIIIECLIYKDLIYSILLSAFLGMVVGGGIFLIASAMIKNSLGMGDVKLMGVIGFNVGIKNLFSCMLISLLLCLVVGCFLILAKRITSKDCIPFAPFLAVGTILTILFKL